jgi:hypothetical protein
MVHLLSSHLLKLRISVQDQRHLLLTCAEKLLERTSIASGTTTLNRRTRRLLRLKAHLLLLLALHIPTHRIPTHRIH